MKVSIVGIGRAGKAVALFLDQLGVGVHYLIDLEMKRAEELTQLIDGSSAAGPEALEFIDDTVVLSVPDDKIREVFLHLWEKNQSPDLFVHLSGMKDSSVFREAENEGKAVASIHPNIAFSKGTDAHLRLHKTVFALEGNDRALQIATRFFGDNQLTHIRIRREDKVLYHAAAVLSANFPVVLADCAMDIYRLIGIDENLSQELVSEYLKNAAQLVSEGLPKEMITGPAIRGDTETVASETRALEAVDESISKVYEILSSIIESWR